MSEDPTLHAQRMRAALQAEMTSGERLLWSGLPDARRMKAAFAIWLFGIPWTVFSIVWTGLAASAWTVRLPQTEMEWGFGIAFPLFGMPFILVGLWMLRMPFTARAEARRTIYGLTDLRLIRVVSGSKRRIESVRLNRMGPIHLSVSKDGWGTVSIQTGSHIDSDGDRITDRFEASAIPEAEKLHRLIVAQQGT